MAIDNENLRQLASLMLSESPAPLAIQQFVGKLIWEGLTQPRSMTAASNDEPVSDMLVFVGDGHRRQDSALGGGHDAADEIHPRGRKLQRGKGTRGEPQLVKPTGRKRTIEEAKVQKEKGYSLGLLDKYVEPARPLPKVFKGAAGEPYCEMLPKRRVARKTG